MNISKYGDSYFPIQPFKNTGGWGRYIILLVNLYVSPALVVVPPVAVTTTPVVALPLLSDLPGQCQGGGGRQEQQNLHICCFFLTAQWRAGCERLCWPGMLAQLSSLILSLVFALTNTKPGCGFICSALDFSDKLTPTYHSPALI